MAPYVSQGVKFSLDLLNDIADIIPAPVRPVVNLVKRAIDVAEEVQSIWEECGALRDRLLRLLPVVIMSAKDASPADQDTLSPAFAEKIEAFSRKLSAILETLEKLQKSAKPKGIAGSLKATLLRKPNADKIKKCNSDLDWEMRVFEVDLHLDAANRLINLAHQLQDIRNGVGAVQAEVVVVQEQVQDVQAGVHSVYDEVIGARVDVQAVQEAVVVASGGINLVKTGVEDLLDAEQRGGLERLPRAKYAAYDSSRPDAPNSCFAGTRVELLKLIQEWLLNMDPDDPRIFWLNGIAGTGKTTIARTIAERSDLEGLLIATFFFSRQGDAELRTPNLVFPTLAYQLARSEPAFARHLSEALKQNPDTPYSSLSSQLRNLIIDPLSKLPQDSERIVLLVFDAFDECEENGAREILQLLVDAAPIFPFYLKIFLTGRPEPHIRTTLGPSEVLKTSVLHDIEKSIVKSDIQLFLRARLAAIPKELEKPLPPGWVTEVEIELLTDQAGSLFIYAAIAMRFVGDTRARNPRRQLNIVLGLSKSPGASPFALLNKLYLHVLGNAISPDDPEHWAKRFRVVVGTMLRLHDSLPAAAVEVLAALEEGEISDAFYHLHSVASSPSPIEHPRFHHPSFPDFIQDITRCPDPRFFIDAKEHDTRLAVRCFEIMEETLHKGMIDDVDPLAMNWETDDHKRRARAAFRLELRYACRYWAIRLKKADITDETLKEALREFARTRLLWWVESMSWLGSMAMAVDELIAARAWAMQSSCSSHTISLLNDTYRLLLTNLSIIREGAMQLYLSALPFCPTNTALRRAYSDEAESTIRVLLGADTRWSQCLGTLKGKGGNATSIAFSPDGRNVAAGFNNGHLQVWDTADDTILDVVREVKSVVTMVAFSGDGSRLALCSAGSARVEVWDPKTGDAVHFLESDKGAVWSVAFSPDSTRVACGTSTGWVKVWDAANAYPVGGIGGHGASTPVRAVTFSSDARHVASASLGSVKMWDTQENKRSTLQYGPGTKTQPTSLIFSSDGQQLVAVWEDSTTSRWDVSSGSILIPAQARESKSVERAASWAIAPGGMRWACGFQDGTIRMLNDFGSEVIVLEGHSSPVTALAFSADGACLVSGDSDGIQKLWGDITSDNNLSGDLPIEGVSCVDFSKDGRFVASGSGDSAVRIWDTGTGTLLQTLEGHDDLVRDMHFCKDGRTLESKSASSTCLWEVGTWTLRPDDSGGCQGGSRSQPFEMPREALGHYLFTIAEEDHFLWRISSSPPDYTRDRLCVIPPALRLTSEYAPFVWRGNHIAFVGGDARRLVILEVLLEAEDEESQPTLGPYGYGRLHLFTQFMYLPLMDKVGGNNVDW